MDSNDELEQPVDKAGGDTTTRRTFVKTGASITGGLLLSGVYAKPRMQSIDLQVLPNPSSGGSNGDPYDPYDRDKKDKKDRKRKKDKKDN